ncbi:30S ribosome-binding factor RbfA [Paraclostridium bifermentans]|uniref:Ribosome-binding factor A n=1 Tax=Paraclostridium bifermentans TaxID=1490 RepID=A0ABY8R608_PARBF|nr:30S ribosome-binding factor RbfA [Paraclostridium bifermentans]
MASYSRTQRIGEEIRKVVSTMLISGIKDYRINSLISVTDVEVTSDLSYAYVYVSILGGNKESSMAGLKSACGYIRKEVGKNVKLRHTPEIIFKIDDSIEKGMYMESLIKKVNEDNSKNKKIFQMILKENN